jgi:hypothetical protein
MAATSTSPRSPNAKVIQNGANATASNVALASFSERQGDPERR